MSALERAQPVGLGRRGTDPTNPTPRWLGPFFGLASASPLLTRALREGILILPRRVHPMHLEHRLRQIEPNRGNFVHGWPPSLELQHSNFGTLMP